MSPTYREMGMGGKPPEGEIEATARAIRQLATLVPDLLAVATAASALVGRSTREPEDQPAGTSLVATAHLDALRAALERLAQPAREAQE